MKLLKLGSKVKQTFEAQLQLTLNNAKVTKASNKINDQVMRKLADQIKAEIPGSGFALITFDIENNETCVNYVSNIADDFMIKALEAQLETLKKRQADPAAQLLGSGS